MRDEHSTFRRALEISLLLHLLLVFLILPKAHEVWPSTRSSLFLAPEQVPVEQTPPLEFEFVDLAEEREETPVSDRVPLSDLDRRAHGGDGEAASRPSSAGNTPQLVQADGGQRFGSSSPPLRPVPETRPVPTPIPEEPEPQEQQPVAEPEPEGAGEEQPRETAAEPVLQLPPQRAWTLPPEQGGLPENPDTEGGRVDTGALSFDTQWYDWGPYAKAMLAKIRRNWQIPEIAQFGADGVVKIRFYIERDGTVTGLAILDESGKPPMDFAARDAIADSSPFEPLPADLTGVTREGITITFYYNVTPPRRRQR